MITRKLQLRYNEKPEDFSYLGENKNKSEQSSIA